MATLLRFPRVVHLAPRAGLAGLALALVAACGGPGPHHARSPDCKIEVLPNPPGDGYVEVGQMEFPGNAMFKPQYSYHSPYTLAAEMREQICAVGGDTLVADRNAAGEIVHAAVYRHIDESDIPAPYTKQPTKGESCEGACGPGTTCEHDVCVPQAQTPQAQAPQAQAPQCEPACAASETCGADGLCHPAE
jgi:hypothetical protein